MIDTWLVPDDPAEEDVRIRYKCSHCGEGITQTSHYMIETEHYHEECIDEILSAIEDDYVREKARYWMDEYKVYGGCE